MKQEPTLTTPCLREVILTPAAVAGATDIPLMDELGGILLDENGLPICEN